ncbi:hypothetical protein N7492_006122 [Penicillium capsulatum]|uniref:AB hydrolase-1 domain-containing protein n=1 Tax=Penicillium capsulatum TaxID=69766 RepID=A0A9W9I2B2_9EURO|nr:hypothetical protein N7492_006122 [Penicillium capsulatum]
MSHFQVIEHTAQCQLCRERPGAVKPGHESQLKLAVKQYIPLDNLSPKEGDVTIIGAHANGFPKGQSGVLNEDILGDDPSWWDHGRDLLSLINQFQGQMSQPLVGIGHSMGGMQLAHLSLLHPSLFEALVLVDPVIQGGNPSRPYAVPSTYRRDLWPSRAEATEKIQSSPFYKSWDPPQELFTFLRSSYIDERSGLPRGVQEDEMYADDMDDFPFYRPEPRQMLQRLPDLKPSVLYLFGSKSELSTPVSRQQKLEITGTGVGGSGGVAKGRVKEAVLPCGHLVPMELVEECARASADFVDFELSAWESRRSQFHRAWSEVSHHERTAIDDQWKAHIGPLAKKSKI